MNDVHVIDTLDALRAFSDPLRQQIIELLHTSPQTASQVARNLGEKPTKLYYHLLEMERYRLIEIAETRQKGNLIEKYYRPVARFYRVDGALFEKGPEVLGVFYQNVSAMLEQSARHLRADIDAGRLTEAEAASSKRMLIHSRLSRADADEFQKRLGDLLDEFGRRTTPDAEVPMNLTLLYYTQVAEKEKP